MLQQCYSNSSVTALQHQCYSVIVLQCYSVTATLVLQRYSSSVTATLYSRVHYVFHLNQAAKSDLLASNCSLECVESQKCRCHFLVYYWFRYSRWRPGWRPAHYNVHILTYTLFIIANSKTIHMNYRSEIIRN